MKNLQGKFFIMALVAILLTGILFGCVVSAPDEGGDTDVKLPVDTEQGENPDGPVVSGDDPADSEDDPLIPDDPVGPQTITVDPNQDWIYDSYTLPSKETDLTESTPDLQKKAEQLFFELGLNLYEDVEYEYFDVIPYKIPAVESLVRRFDWELFVNTYSKEYAYEASDFVLIGKVSNSEEYAIHYIVFEDGTYSVESETCSAGEDKNKEIMNALDTKDFSKLEFWIATYYIQRFLFEPEFSSPSDVSGEGVVSFLGHNQYNFGTTVFNLFPRPYSAVEKEVADAFIQKYIPGAKIEGGTYIRFEVIESENWYFTEAKVIDDYPYSYSIIGSKIEDGCLWVDSLETEKRENDNIIRTYRYLFDIHDEYISVKSKTLLSEEIAENIGFVKTQSPDIDGYTYIGDAEYGNVVYKSDTSGRMYILFNGYLQYSDLPAFDDIYDPEPITEVKEGTAHVWNADDAIVVTAEIDEIDTLYLNSVHYYGPGDSDRAYPYDGWFVIPSIRVSGAKGTISITPQESVLDREMTIDVYNNDDAVLTNRLYSGVFSKNTTIELPIEVNAEEPETEFFIVVKFGDTNDVSVALLRYYFSADSELQVRSTNYDEDVVATTNLETRQWVQRP